MEIGLENRGGLRPASPRAILPRCGQGQEDPRLFLFFAGIGRGPEVSLETKRGRRPPGKPPKPLSSKRHKILWTRPPRPSDPTTSGQARPWRTPDVVDAGKWSGRRDSNSRPPVPKTGALPDCATPRPCSALIPARWPCASPGAHSAAQGQLARSAAMAGWRISSPTDSPSCAAMPPLISSTYWMSGPPGIGRAVHADSRSRGGGAPCRFRSDNDHVVRGFSVFSIKKETAWGHS